jgi:hypothetical protein
MQLNLPINAQCTSGDLMHKTHNSGHGIVFNRSVQNLLCKESREKERRIVRGRIASDKDKGAHGYWGSSDKP